MPDDLKADLAQSIRFALRLKILNPQARKAIRGLSDHAVDRMADDIAAHLLLSGWYHRPLAETQFAGPGFMSGLPQGSPLAPREAEPEKGDRE